MTIHCHDLVRLKGDRRTWVVIHSYPDASPPEAMIEPAGEAWNRQPKLVPIADLTLVPDLGDFD